MATTAWDELSGKRFGHFEVLNTVGHGAFGTVLKARDPKLDRIVALKIPRPFTRPTMPNWIALCTDEGAGLWAGLNVLPKTTFATDYSYRTERLMHEHLTTALITKTPLGEAPHTFNLDFHAIPFRGNEPDLEKHWVPLRNRALRR